MPSRIKNLELEISHLNEALAHENLVGLLKSNKLFSERFLYRGTGEDELRETQGKRARMERNLVLEGMRVGGFSIDCYTKSQMEEILKNGELKSPIFYAEGSENPAVIVYKAECLRYAGKRSDFEYVFKRQNKTKSIAAIVWLV